MFFGCLPCCGGDCVPAYPDSSAVSYSAEIGLNLSITGTTNGNSLAYTFGNTINIQWPYGFTTGTYPADGSFVSAGMAGSLQGWGWNYRIDAQAGLNGISFATGFYENSYPNLMPRHILGDSRFSTYVAGAGGLVRTSRNTILTYFGSGWSNAESYFTLAGLDGAYQNNGNVITNLGSGGRAFESYTPDRNNDCNALPLVVQTLQEGFSFTINGETHSFDVATTISIESFIWTDSDGVQRDCLHAPQRPNLSGFPNNIFSGVNHPTYPPPY